MPSAIGGGYGVATPAVPAGVIVIADQPDGGFITHIQQAKAISYNGYTYLGYIASTGNVEVLAVNESTGVPTTPVVLHTFSTADTHNSPAMLIRPSDNKLLVVYSDHNGAQMYRRISTTSLTTDPDLGDGFAAEGGLFSQLGSWATFTYPILLQLTDETNDPIYMFWRERHSTDRLRFSTSTDGGSTWAASKIIAKADTIATSKTYWMIGTNGTDRFDVLFCDYSDGADSQMHHFYYTAGEYFQSDGTSIITQAAIDANNGLAMTKADMTLVLSNASGAVDRSFGVCWDGTAPAGLAWQRNGSSDNRLVSVRWRSGAWQTDTVVNSVGGTIAGNLYVSGGAMSYTDPDVVVVPKLISGVWEMFRYTSADDGVTWTPETLTSSSGADNMQPTMVWDASADIQAIWCYGSFTDEDHFSVGLRAIAA